MHGRCAAGSCFVFDTGWRQQDKLRGRAIVQYAKSMHGEMRCRTSLGWRLQDKLLGPSAPQSSCLQSKGEMSTRCQICRSVDRWNGRFCLSLSSGRTVQYKPNAQSLRLFGLHGDVNDAHRAGTNRFQKNILARVAQCRAKKADESVVPSH